MPTRAGFAGGAAGRAASKVYGLRQMRRAATRWKIPLWVLVGVKVQESGTGSGLGATSSAGAQGPFQFMPGTAQSYKVNPGNFASSADGAAHYLHDLYRQFGDWNKAIEAYNAGPGGVGHAEYNESDVKHNAFSVGVNPNLVAKDFQLSARFVHKLFLLGFGGETVNKIEQVLAANGETARAYESRANKIGSVKQLEALVEETEKSPLQAAIESVTPANPVQGIADFFSLIVQPAFWLRVLEVLIGLVLGYMGLKTLTGLELPSPPAVGKVGPLRWSTPGLHP